MVWDEANFVIERHNGIMITESNLMQRTISAALSGREGAKSLQKLINRLNVDTVPFERPVEGLEEEHDRWSAAT